MITFRMKKSLILNNVCIMSTSDIMIINIVCHEKSLLQMHTHNIRVCLIVLLYSFMSKCKN